MVICDILPITDKTPVDQPVAQTLHPFKAMGGVKALKEGNEATQTVLQKHERFLTQHIFVIRASILDQWSESCSSYIKASKRNQVAHGGSIFAI